MRLRTTPGRLEYPPSLQISSIRSDPKTVRMISYSRECLTIAFLLVFYIQNFTGKIIIAITAVTVKFVLKF